MYAELLAFLLIIILLTHILACIFYFFTTIHVDSWLNNVDLLGQAVIENYIASVYWIVTTICTVGFGDIVSTRNMEIYLNLLAIMIGVIVYSFLVGMLSSILNSENAKTNIVMNRFNQLNMFEETVYNAKAVLENITYDLEFYEENMNFLEKEE